MKTRKTLSTIAGLLMAGAALAQQTGEIRGRVLITLVDVATAGVGLPDLDELTSHRPSVAVDHPAGHHYPFADGFA